MSAAPADCPHLAAALHDLATPPDGLGWNLAELHGLIPAGGFAGAAVLVGLVPRREGTQVLLTRRTDGMRNHGGQVSFPGGRIEAGDRDAIAAALRETHEEIGVCPAQVAPLGYLDPLATITGFRILPVVATISPDYLAQPDPREVAEVFEVPLAFLLDPANVAAHTFDLLGRPRAVWEYRYPAQRIWGATASILLNLRDRLQGTRS